MTRGPMSRFAANISIAQNKVVFVCLRPITTGRGQSYLGLQSRLSTLSTELASVRRGGSCATDKTGSGVAGCRAVCQEE